MMDKPISLQFAILHTLKQDKKTPRHQGQLPLI
jgi:hypothetical protein